MREATSPFLKASRQAFIVILVHVIICTEYTESKHLSKIPPCNHDEIAERDPYIVKVASQEGGIHKRKSGYANIRIHPILTVTVSRANEFFHGEDSPFSRAIDTLQRLLLVRPVQGNLVIPPICREYTSGVNEGKCMAPLPSQDDYKCGRFGRIPHQYIGTREVCDASNSSCKTEGPNGAGLPNADYLLFVSVSSIASCYVGTLAFASYCMLDDNDNNRPVVGYINICPSALDNLRRQPGAIYGLFLHEIIHALGFSSRLFDKFVDDNGNTYNPAKKITGPYGSTYIFTGPKTLAFARQYYACDDIEGVYLENEGGSGTASSHWDKRTLNHEIMTGSISNDYDVLSKFTLLLLEDSGWYKVNYAALDNLRQNPLQWGKGLGCPFLTERCTNKSVFPYLCDTSETQLVCTYDHLSKGTCSTRWKGFDGCAVALANIPEHHCRIYAASQLQPFDYVEVYGDSSICVDGIRSLSCSTLRMSHCMVHEAYTVNGSYQYALQFQNEKYKCRDGHVLTTDHYFMPLCPPTEQVVSRSPLVLNEISSLPSSTVGKVTTDLSALKDSIHSDKSIVAFGKLSSFRGVNIKFYVNSKQKNGESFICLSAGCKTCIAPIIVDSTTSILTTNRLYTVARRTFSANAMFVDSLTQSRDYTLVLMSDLQANHSFVYYAASVNFVGNFLQALHSNDDFYIRIVALASNTEIRIAPNQDVYIDKSYYIFHRNEIVYTLGSGEEITISSKRDLTGTRVTVNRAVSFYSGHYCSPGKTTSCSILNEQIPPYNSWGNTFVLHTNVNGVKGNMFKIIASDVGANVVINCTTDGTDYEAYDLNLGFRQHRVLSLTHDYCTLKSDNNILIIQFRDSSPPLMDTFMTIIPSLVHYEDNYVLNAYEDFDNYITITVTNTNVSTNSILLDDSPIAMTWTIIELDGDSYYFATLTLSVGRHTLAFSKHSITFGVIVYGLNEKGSFALPAGLRIDVAKIFARQAPSSVDNLLVTLVDRVINITWSPPSVANGVILQYIVHRMSSSGESYHHVPGDQNYLELPYFNDALVFVAAVNQYGQSSFEVARSSDPCQPSPCINNGNCVASFFRQYCDCGDASFGKYCESTQRLYPFGSAYNDMLLPPSDDSNSPLIRLSEKFVFYNKKFRIIYVNTNGILSFERPFISFSARSLPLHGNNHILAPYWADVDTTGTGKIFYRQTADPSLLTRASSEIQRAYGLSQNFAIRNLFIATWYKVGLFPSRTDKTNTFQCILASSQYESFVMFLYADIQWTRTGALAGINVGDGLNHITLPGAQSSNILNIQKMSNIGIPGVWIFKVGEDCRPSIYTCVSELYPFGLTHGDAALSDERSPKIQLSKNFYFYKEAVRVVYINDNGIISFNGPFNHPFPLSLPLRGAQQIIAPYWADVDARGTGKIYYRQSLDPILLARASREIQTALSLGQNIQIKNLLIATWDAVGYYNRKTDKVNTFQCILATSEIESFVIFLYADLQWTTADSSFGTRGLGGFRALAGYNAGDKSNAHTIAGSRTSKILEIAKTSNVGIPGTWIFKVGEDCSRRIVRDVVFVIDSSSSIGSSKFQLVRELTVDIASRLKVNSPESLFGLITFDDFAQYQFDISTYTNLSTLLPAINPGLPYYGGYSTNTASALRLLLSGGGEGGYLHLRDKTSNVAIVITDGYASSYSSLQLAASALHAANIFDVYAVGIGNNSYSELQLIASDPSFVFPINSLTEVTAEQLVENVIEQLCSTHAPRIYLRPSYYVWKGTVGEPHNLVCLIALSSTAQSNSVKLAWKFTTNDTRVRVTPTTITTDDSIGIIYATVIQFDYLIEGDEGKYKCALTIDGDSAESTFDLEIINPIVAISVTSTVDPEIYQPLVLQCNATIVRGVTSTVDIIWTTDNTQVRRVNNVTTSSHINSSSIYNDSFIISSLNINDVRNVYHCEILINSVLSNAAKANFTISIPGSKCLNSSIQDVVFVIDASSSVGSSRFQLIREFTANIATKLILDSPKSLFAVILFSTNAHVQFNLQSYVNLSSLLSAINNLPYNGGGTNTDEALTLLLSTAKNGMLGLRSNSSKVAIVITGGPSDHHYLTLSTAAELNNSNVFDTIIAVGFKGAVMSELEKIASSPKLVLFTNVFDAIYLQQLQYRVLMELCNYTFLNITVQLNGSDQSTVGQRQDVICSISVPPDVDPDTIELGWLNEEDIVTDDSRVTIYTSSDYSDYSPLASTVQFGPLIEDDQGEYTCYAMINGLFLFQSITIEDFKIPISLVQITIFDNEILGITNLAIGDQLTLDCTVTAVRGISSSVNIIWTTGNIELRRVNNITADIVNNSAIYSDSFEISSLSALDNGREYQCTVMINATQPINSSDQITVVLNAPTCFNTTSCEGDSFSDNSLSYVQCCFELSGASFASSGKCLLCPKDEGCDPTTATCITEFYFFGVPENDSVLNGDTSMAVTLSENFYFYDQTVRVLYVGSNGIISMNHPFNNWLPKSLPFNPAGFITPYWAEVDLWGAGQIYYRQTKNPVLLARATYEIQKVFPLPYPFSQYLTVTNLFIVTWDAVGYYSRGTDKTNTFQCVLASTTTESFVMFLYADGRIQWTTGDASDGTDGLGGTEALAGINAGDGINSLTIPGSLTSDIINITQTSNVNNPGVWIFKVGEGYRCSGNSVKDVVFLIDTSLSIGYPRFQLIKEFVAKITTELIRNSPRSAVGVILFEDVAHLEFNLQAYDNFTALISAINNLPYTKGGTGTAEALTLLLSTAQDGTLGLRSESSKVAIVITDGSSNNQSATSSAATALHASNIFEIVTVGIESADLTELQGIASNRELVFFTHYFYINNLLQLKNEILIRLCFDQTIPNILSDQTTVGQRQDVICSISVPPDVDPDTIELGWLNEDDIVTDNSRVTIIRSSNHSGNTSSNFSKIITTVIQFDPLFEDDKGNYSCYSIANKSVKYISTQLNNFTIPNPLVKISIFDNAIILGNESVGSLVLGDPLTLDCTVTAVRGISSSVNIVWTTGGRVVRSVDDITADIENDTAIYTDSFEISSLSAIDNETEYQCTVMINATQPILRSTQVMLIFSADIDECTLNIDDCDQLCVNDIGSYHCECYNGYFRDANSCADINECAGDHGCHHFCNNTDGSFHCYCNPGHMLHSNGTTCTDINECLINNGGCEFSCTNLEGINNTTGLGYQCGCNNGYQLAPNNHDCNDVPNCLINDHNCSQICVELEGSFSCFCYPGYELQEDRATCLDIDECEEGADECDHNCTNTDGSYYCTCMDGYELESDNHTCKDINECARGIADCPHICNNTAGGYFCTCNTGYASTLDQKYCIAVCPAGCFNGGNCLSPGICTCHSGWTGDNCTQDIDECALNIDDCDQLCVNDMGSYHCECYTGYFKDSNSSCVDINECAGDHGCHHLCNNTDGSFHCYCDPGYMLHSNETACIDVDECLVNNGGCEFSCTNLEGINSTTGLGYQCGCDYGYQLAPDNHNCSDINECLDNNGTCSHNCVNTEGSYHCKCVAGYILQPNKYDCEDINECLTNNGGCDHICINNQGSFECSCNTTYTLAKDNETCILYAADCDYVLEKPSGYISTPGFPNSPYAPFSNCTWIIDLPAYKRIELNFDVMAIEDSPDCTRDQLTILNGKDSDSLSLGSYCGNKLPATIKSSTESVIIKFISDGTVSNKGFSLEYKGLKKRSKDTFDCYVAESRNTVFGLSTFPSKYNGPINCVYYFFSPLQNLKVKITFLYLDILAADCNTDRIEISDGFRSTSSEKICNGSKIIEFISSKQVVRIAYIGNSVGKYRGFHAAVTFL